MPFWAPDQPSPRHTHDPAPSTEPLGLTHDPDLSAQLHAFNLGTQLPLAPTLAVPEE